MNNKSSTHNLWLFIYQRAVDILDEHYVKYKVLCNLLQPWPQNSAVKAQFTCKHQQDVLQHIRRVSLDVDLFRSFIKSDEPQKISHSRSIRARSTAEYLLGLFGDVRGWKQLWGPHLLGIITIFSCYPTHLKDPSRSLFHPDCFVCVWWWWRGGSVGRKADVLFSR